MLKPKHPNNYKFQPYTGLLRTLLLRNILESSIDVSREQIIYASYCGCIKLLCGYCKVMFNRFNMKDSIAVEIPSQGNGRYRTQFAMFHVLEERLIVIDS